MEYNKLTDKDSNDIQESVVKITDMADIMSDYCEFNSDNPKVNILVLQLDNIKEECKKISDKF